MTRLLALFLLTTPLLADVEVPPRMLAPATAEESWNIIRLATASVERLIEEKRPLEVTSQISLLSPALRVLARQPVKAGTEALIERQSVQAFQLVNLIAQNSLSENIDALPPAFKKLRTTLDDIATGFEPAVVKAELHHCLTHSEILGKPGDKCPQCKQPLLPRRIPYSFIYARPKEPTTQLTITSKTPAEAGKEVTLTAKLQTLDGKPVVENHLWPMHTQRVQFLITGPRLEDFHHLPAKAASTPGDYTITFTPALSGTYRVRAGLTPAGTGIPEYPAADLSVAGNVPGIANHAPPGMSSEVAGYHLKLGVIGSKGLLLRSGQLQGLQLTIKDAAGQPVTRLEPFLQAFAHLNAFYEGSDTLLQLHPTGGDILRDDVRGGPDFTFKMFSPQPGPLRLYALIRIDGKILQAPFTLQVHP
ncbi:MAG: hypothetical protein JNN17_09760 [Verrucomicrobiaceae bacterium]|nr:hypothetical protein [Verrucomicrobiaceae bacterium]